MASAKAMPVSGPQLDNRRVLAALIDLAIVAVGAALIFAAGGVLGDSPSDIGTPLLAVALGWALYYYFACESSDSAQTVGKRVMKIRVARMDGGRLEMRDVAVRTVLRVVDGLFAYLVGLIVMLATGERRGRLGDLAANTKIVSADAPASSPVAAAAATATEPSALRVPIAESGPAFEPVAEEEPVAEGEPVAEEEPEAEAADEDTVDMASPSLQELAADVEATAGTAPDEEEPVAEEPVAEEEPVDDDLVDDDPLAGEEDDAVEAESGAEIESGAEEPVAEDAPAAEPVAEEDAAPEPVADPEPDEGEDEELAPAAEADSEDDDEIERIETISAIDLVMEDSRRKS